MAPYRVQLWCCDVNGLSRSVERTKGACWRGYRARNQLWTRQRKKWGLGHHTKGEQTKLYPRTSPRPRTTQNEARATNGL